MKLNTLTPSIIALTTLVAMGCGKDAPKSTGSEPAAEEAAAPKELSTLFTGEAPTVPSVYKALRPGMTPEEFKKINPALPKDDDLRVPGYEMTFHMGFDDDTHKLSRLYFDLPKDRAETLISAAWGKAIDAKDSIDRPLKIWFNPDAGLRAVLEEGYGDDMKLELTAYIAAEKFIGTKPGPIFDFEAKRPLLGASVDQVREGYADVIVETSKAEAKKNREEMEKMMGADKDKLAILGDAKPSIHLDFLPTELESYWTRVNMSFDDAQKVERFYFTLAYGGRPEFKAPLFEMLKKKLGPLTEGEYLGDKIFFFQNEQLRVEIKDDTIMKGWSVTVMPPEKP